MRSARWLHFIILLAVAGVLMLPRLGSPALWDMDEGVNAECTREMMEIGTWIVPTYNYELRTAKPIMLYWLQRLSYETFGIGEWSARLPSVLMTFGTMLLVYHLGRRMIGPTAGLLAAIIFASSLEVGKLAHAATPDATFVFFNTLTLALFWFGHPHGRWFGRAAVACGCAVLTKGPAGLALPGLVIALYLLWNRELGRLLDHRLLRGILIFILVTLPWYGLVTAETRGAYLRAFVGNENVNRFLTPMESHSGSPAYYLGAMLLFCAPWSVFLGGAMWYGVRGGLSPLSRLSGRGAGGEGVLLEQPKTLTPNSSPAKPEEGGRSTDAPRFLLCWVAAYLAVFSVAATKLPNYIAPLYPALALLTARFLILWVREQIAPRRWVMPAAAGGLAFVGLAVGCGLLITGGAVPLELKGLRRMPGLAPWAAVGLIPIAGAILMAWFLRQNNRRDAVASAAFASVAFLAVTLAFPVVVMDRYKAPRELVAQSGAKQPLREIRLASLDYTQESVTFYAERRVERLATPTAAADFLAMPRPGYLFLPALLWDEQFAGKLDNVRVAARRYDFYRNADIVVVTNDGVQP